MEIRASTPIEMQRIVHRFQRLVRLGVFQMRGIGNVFARIGPCRADQDALAVSAAF